MARYLEIRLPVSGLERCPACHPERSEGSLRPLSQTLRCAQGDTHYLQMSTSWLCRTGYTKTVICRVYNNCEIDTHSLNLRSVQSWTCKTIVLSGYTASAIINLDIQPFGRKYSTSTSISLIPLLISSRCTGGACS